MPNHVTHKIEFEKKYAEQIFAAVIGDDGCFDFNVLVPQPPQIYLGDLGREDEEDFKCNWHSWNVLNWGTKWGAYNGAFGVEGEKAFIKFDTAWSVPYPVISAFAYRFKIPFEHRYFDEGPNFWGVENWGFVENRETFNRLKTRKSNPEDKGLLSIELKGWDFTKPDEDEDGETE